MRMEFAAERCGANRISLSALSIARTAKAAQSSSGRNAIAAPDVTEATGETAERVARASDRG